MRDHSVCFQSLQRTCLRSQFGKKVQPFISSWGGGVSILWIAYNIFVKTIFGIICESILFVVEVVAIINVIRQRKKNGTSPKNVEEENIKQTE